MADESNNQGTNLESNASNQREIYRRKSDVIFFCAFFVGAYLGIYFWVGNSTFVPSVNLITIVVWETICFIAILIFSHLAKEPVDIGFGPIPRSEKSVLVLLVVTTILFIVLLSIPIFFLGGIRDSCLTTMLASMCGITLILTESWKIRLLITGICLSICVISSWEGLYFPIEVQDPGTYNLLYTGSVICTILVTLVLNWKVKGPFLPRT